MIYKLRKETVDNLSAKEQVLYNRGLDVCEINAYLNTTDKIISSPLLLGEDKLKKALGLIVKAAKDNRKCYVKVDPDCDGYSSASLLMNYLYDLFPSWVVNYVVFLMAEDKTHGLSDVMDLIEDGSLVICPDSASNDYKQHKDLTIRGCDIIVLDHHEAPRDSEYAIVINNQMSDYPNKMLCGVGIVWQFCRFIDSIVNKDFAEQYIDLVSLGNTADMMSLLSFETKHLIIKGLKNVNNPFFYYLSEKNKFSIGEELTSIGVGFYIAPFINAMTRSGTIEEKTLLFNAMLKYKAFEKIPSNKRGHRPGDMERIVDQALRTVTNVKSRQKKAEDLGLERTAAKIVSENLLENKILIIKGESIVPKNIAGLVANKYANKFGRPCLVLNKFPNASVERIDENGDSYFEEVEKTYYVGSARGFEDSGMLNFKDICLETGEVVFAAGHQGAFGIGIFEENMDKFIEKTNEVLKDLPNEPVYLLDYLFDENTINGEFILEIAQLKYLWGKDIKESFIGIENLLVTPDMVTLMSPDKKPTLKITVGNTSLIKFGSSEEEFQKIHNYGQGWVKINVVGKCNANTFQGSTSPQLLIQDYEIVDSGNYLF